MPKSAIHQQLLVTLSELGFVDLASEALEKIALGWSRFDMEAIRQYQRGARQSKDVAGFILTVSNGRLQKMATTVLRLCTDEATGKISPLYITEVYGTKGGDIPTAPLAYAWLKNVLDRAENATFGRAGERKKMSAGRIHRHKGRRSRGR